MIQRERTLQTLKVIQLMRERGLSVEEAKTKLSGVLKFDVTKIRLK